MGVLHHRRELLLEGEAPEALPGGARHPHLEAPEVVDWQSSGFRTTVEPADQLHPFPSLDDYLVAAPNPPTLGTLRTHQLELVSDEFDRVLANWPVLSALYWEFDLAGEFYVLAEGNWWRIDAEYRDRIDASVGAIPIADLLRPEFDTDVEEERDYNKRLAEFQPGRIMLDRKMARFTNENGTVEPCDVMTLARQFVHVKRDTSSGALSHLFAQAEVSARFFLMLPEFREQMRRLIANSDTPADIRRDFVELVPESRPIPTEYEVVLAIITADAEPIATKLPFFARNFLAFIEPAITNMGYTVKLAAIAERAGARPADAGPLARELETEPASVVMRSTKRKRTSSIQRGRQPTRAPSRVRTA